MWLPMIIFGAFLLLMVHCYFTRGGVWTAKIFIGGITLFIAKEIQNQHNEPIRYRAGESAFYFLHVPWAVVFGWVFAIYVGWIISERLLYTYKRDLYGKTFPTIGLASIIVFFISMAMEVTGTQMGWWTWTATEMHIFKPVVLGLPMLVYMEWMRVCFTILTYALLLEFTELRRNKWRYVHFLFSFIVTIPIYLAAQAIKKPFGSDVLLDNPSLILPNLSLLFFLGVIMLKNRKPWTELYLFTWSFQIYNCYMNPFSWYAGVWIFAHAIGYLFYRKSELSADWLIFSPIDKARTPKSKARNARESEGSVSFSVAQKNGTGNI